MEEETKFHWVEGMKYALEGIKTSFLLNGAATVSILTFIGNSKNSSNLLVFAMGLFAFGAATGPISHLLAYITQLKYGNAAMGVSTPENDWTEATKMHYWVYFSVALGIVSFLIGIFLAGISLWDFSLSTPD